MITISTLFHFYWGGRHLVPNFLKVGGGGDIKKWVPRRTKRVPATDMFLGGATMFLVKQVFVK